MREEREGFGQGGDVADPTDGLGGRLRQAREDAGISLRELARRIGMSASLISQIETNKVQPSVSTLYAIVSELGVSMDAVVFGRRREAGHRAAARNPGIGRAADGPLVQRADTRAHASFRTGVRWERLAPPTVTGAEFLRVVYEPGAESSPAGTFHRHAGREWCVVLRGRLHVSMGFDDWVLGPGDSITYDSTVPHRLANPGDEVAEALWFQLGELPAGWEG